jgi:dTDP-4-dehydrorhamnose reductase
MRILLTGARGQVGTEFCRAWETAGEVLTPRRDELDLSDPPGVRNYVRAQKPYVIVNAGAYTAVDLAEKERELCFAVNAAAPVALAEEAAKLGALFIHFSTDYVFDGEKTGAYTEEDAPHPLGVYGASKLEGELGVSAIGGRSLVLRTSWVYSLHGKNFLLTMLRLAKEKPELRIVDDQIGAPTSAREIAAATARLIKTVGAADLGDFPKGIYHMTAEGATSWCGFAKAIVSRAGLNSPPRITRITTAEYPTPATRPKNSVLSNRKFEAAFGFRLGLWQTGLEDLMEKRTAGV